ncbi:hypothetical protein BD310DRAFT_940349 [Dichomitus squalens]|uniref:Uncharacterized protein n=1 Tax=Dichomitus squalens TaxID=114155 RepID=A0A4Q9PC85_9APHY|nr:hypothetical protein BD310DRAFT_940349 [Dichomitus squalens]
MRSSRGKTCSSGSRSASCTTGSRSLSRSWIKLTTPQSTDPSSRHFSPSWTFSLSVSLSLALILSCKLLLYTRCPAAASATPDSTHDGLSASPLAPYHRSRSPSSPGCSGLRIAALYWHTRKSIVQCSICDTPG